MTDSKWKKGWKVIRLLRDPASIYYLRVKGRIRRATYSNRISVTYNERAKPVCYKKGKIVGRPRNCGPLAVFKTRKQARMFVKHICPGKIVKCLYIESKHKTLWENGNEAHWYNLPPGTVFAEKVKCLE